jgi:hypothetical protein
MSQKILQGNQFEPTTEEKYKHKNRNSDNHFQTKWPLHVTFESKVDATKDIFRSREVLQMTLPSAGICERNSVRR